MFFKSFFKISFLVLLFSIAIRIVYINQTTYSDQDEHAFKLQEEEFSRSVKTWRNKGNFFLYKGKYKVFYILSKITNENDNLNEVTINKPLKIDASIQVNVFLHGFPTSSYDFSKVWNQFSVSNQQLISESRVKPVYLLAFDYIGYGFSDKPFNYTYSLFDNADLCDSLLLHLNILNVNLVAHDIGDSVAQEILRRYNLNQLNFKIDSAVLSNGGIFYDIYQPVLAQRILRVEELSQLFAKYFINQYVFQFTFKKLFGKLHRASNEVFNEINDFFSIIAYKHGHLSWPQTIKYLDERHQYNEVWLNALNETKVDTILIFGPDDPINPDQEFTLKIRNDLPNVKLVKLNAVVGHYPQWEDSFTFFDIINKFLFRNSKSTRQ